MVKTNKQDRVAVALERIADALETQIKMFKVFYEKIEKHAEANAKAAECYVKQCTPKPIDTEQELRLTMQDPKYWKDQDPETVRRVGDGFARLYKNYKVEKVNELVDGKIQAMGFATADSIKGDFEQWKKRNCKNG